MMGIFVAVIYFAVFIILSQMLMPPEYNWRVNTISELAAQGYKHKGIMQAGFIGFGILLPAHLTYNLLFQGGDVLIGLPIILYALSVGMSGVFCTEPFVDAKYSEGEAKIHSLLAQFAGFFFVSGIVICMVREQVMIIKLLHAAAVLFVMLCSLMFARSPRFRGVYQRVMYLGSFMWLLFLYEI